MERKMILQTNPNSWSCLPTAFAMVLDIPLSELIDMVGHDGSEKVLPNLPDPYCRRAFHIQEMMKVAYKLGYLVTPFVPNPTFLVLEYEHSYKEPEFDSLVKQNVGVLTGYTKFSDKPHAVAWNGQLIFDPIGSRYTLDLFRIEELWVINERANRKVEEG